MFLMLHVASKIVNHLFFAQIGKLNGCELAWDVKTLNFMDIKLNGFTVHVLLFVNWCWFIDL